MAWFNYLKEQGFFSPSNNPAPVKLQNGYNVPHWEILDYLEKTAELISKSEHLHLVPEILSFIKEVSENPVDNYKTNYRLIKILSMMPNDSVEESYLNFIPVWVDSTMDTTLQTHEICTSLLPKFLSGGSDADMKKAEIILCHLFELKKNQNSENGDGYSHYSYDSSFHLYHLQQYFIDEKQIDVVAQKSGSIALYKLLNSVNFLLRDSETTAQGTCDNITYNFKIAKCFQNLNIQVDKIEDGQSEIIFNDSVPNYVDKDSHWLYEYLKHIFDTCQISNAIFDTIHERLDFNLKNDISSLFGHDGIKELDEEVQNSEKTVTLLSLILRQWLTALANQPDPRSINKVFADLLESPRYDIPFFRRMVLYVASQNWNVLRPWFWKIVDNNDALQIFSRDCYKLELYFLLSAIAEELDQHEAEKIIAILEKGPQERKTYTPDKEYWQHRWLDALQKNKNFSELYKKNNELHRFEQDYSNEGKIKVRIGNESPFSAEEISVMDEKELVDKILNFENSSKWNGPNIEGFADELEKAVIANPKKFTQVLNKLNDAGYIYICHILSGFESAWKADRDFDWNELLDFCMNYISSNGFINSGIQNKDKLRTDKNWVYSNIASLISISCQNDEHSIRIDLVPKAKELLLKIVPLVESKKIDAGLETDFVMHAINSTYGRILRAIIDFSLKLVRNIEDDIKKENWDKDFNLVFSYSLDGESFEAFTFLGMYIQQFMYLDDSWLQNKLRKIDSSGDKLWLAFLRGLAYSRPLSIEYYKILYPCYLKGIENKIFEQRHGKPLQRHLLAYYLWNYEENFEDSLFFNLIDKDASPVLIGQLATLTLQQLKAVEKDSSVSYRDFFLKFLRIWRTLNKKIKNFEDPADFKHIRSISHFNDYVESLSNENFSLINDNIEYFSDFHSNISLIKNIIRWTKNSPAELISNLSDRLKFEYVQQPEPIIELTEYLYKNKQNATANKIANQLAMNGYDFLRPLFQKYNS